MRPRNPYAELRALVDSTRQLDPEEVAELQLEQGYADRALGIYEALVAQEPANVHYRRRRDWLARLATVRQRPVRCVSASTPPPPDDPPPRFAASDPAIEESGLRPAARRSVGVDATLRGMTPPTRPRVITRRGRNAAPPSNAPTVVRQLPIRPIS